MPEGLLTPVLGTVVLWSASALAAVVLAGVLAAASVSRSALVRRPAEAVILLTRGVPTSLLVIVAGLAAMPYPAPDWLPNPFPGTSAGMALVGWAVTAALAFGSTGHLAVIFRTGYRSLGATRLEQVHLLGLGAAGRTRLLVRESAKASLAPTGARLVHHLHNTGFAALFPVADLFGWVQQRSHETFDVTRYAAIGVAAYVALSMMIWAATRALEASLGAPPRARLVRRPVAAAVVGTRAGSVS
jgi:ABC-type amino acid transport system permease subunit